MKLLLQAIEPSADALGAGLMRALETRAPKPLHFVGVGGPAMARLGLRSLFDPSELSVLGAWEGIAVYPKVRGRLGELAALARAERPDAAVLIDAWGMSHRLARRLQALQPRPKVVKYVAPQVWASRPGRARLLARRVDLLLAITPFDAPFFEPLGLRTVFVGNPAAHRRPPTSAAIGEARARLGLGERPVLLVLPGSRPAEATRLMRPFGEAAARLVARRPDVAVLVAPAEAVMAQAKEALGSWAVAARLLDSCGRDDAIAAATVALACSGTVTTELAAQGVPMVVGYRLGFFTHQAAKVLVTTPYITLVNAAAGRFVAPELVQRACTGEALARELALRLDDPTLRARQVEAQSEAVAKLRGGVEDPADAAAKAILDMLGG